MLLHLLLICTCYTVVSTRPHIVLIIADDLGWNDVGFHGMSQMPTPNIDALAASGIILQNYYVNPICTPSRAALMTGKYPIHTGMQHGVIYGAEPRGLPLSERILPQYLKELGYSTHLVGKWHLGSYKKEYLPLNRGFDSHLGFWTGKIDMFDHTTMEKGVWGHDFRRGFEVAYDLYGQYVTDIYTAEAIKIIRSHNRNVPLFLTVAHSAVHSGNDYEFLRAPDTVIDRFHHINDTQRRKFAGMLSKLDDSVGQVMAALSSRGLLQDSVVLFTTDNGGVPDGFNSNAGSNWPLRGTKNTLWEGGIRGSAVLWSPLLEHRSRVATQKMHIVDLLPTLYSIAGGNISNLRGLDGVDQWDALSKNLESQRNQTVYNIDDLEDIASISIGPWKIIKGTTYKGKWDGWYGPPARLEPYDIDLVYRSAVAAAAASLSLMPTREQYATVRDDATINCNTTLPEIKCKPLKEPCLYNIVDDPCELRNLAMREPQILQILLSELDKARASMVPPNNKPIDEAGDPKYWGHVFTNFADYVLPYNRILVKKGR